MVLALIGSTETRGSRRMKTIRQLLYKEILTSVAFVTLGFLALFFFFDFVDELRWVGKAGENSYQLAQAVLVVGLMVPSHLYELLPITVLIGTIFVMARLAQSSEYTILRTSGLGPWRALHTLLTLGLLFVLITFQGDITIGQTGAWLKEKQNEHSFAANVSALTSSGQMQGIRIFEFGSNGLLVSLTHGDKAVFADDGSWTLSNVERSEFHTQASDNASVERSHLASYRWPTEITAEMVSTALLKPDRMATLDLFQYIRHLNANGQSAQRYEIEFWRKVFYPLSCLVMVVLALPFAYLHFRAGGITSYVFGGVMAGISFFLLNNVFGYIGNLQNWQPWLTAASPGIIYSMLSLAAFGWLVLRR